MSEEPGEEIGTIDYVVVEFPGQVFNGDLAPDLIDLVDRGLVRIIDLLLLHKDQDGIVTAVELEEAPAEEAGLLVTVERGFPGLLPDEDIAAAGEALEPDTSAALIVWENLWVAPLATAIRRRGGQLVASGRIPIAEVLESIEAIEAAERGDS